MFTILDQRYRDIIADISDTLAGMSLDPRLMPRPATPASEVAQRTIRSSASTPSLRSRDGTVPPHAKMDPGGNVRVVVRVRAFLPRGTAFPAQCDAVETPPADLFTLESQRPNAMPSA
jgi:hypothetical protein